MNNSLDSIRIIPVENLPKEFKMGGKPRTLSFTPEEVERLSQIGRAASINNGEAIDENHTRQR